MMIILESHWNEICEPHKFKQDVYKRQAEGCNIVTETKENAGLQTVMSNSFGFGGTNATLVFKRYNG